MHVGFPVERVPAAESRNMSLSPKALVAKLAANRVLRRDRDRREFTRCLQRMPGYLAPSQFIFGAQASADAEVEFIADRDFVRREFAVELPPPEPEYRENMFRITDKDLRQIADATEALGSAGQEIVHAASRFTQASPR
jgi:hypothetical protein